MNIIIKSVIPNHQKKIIKEYTGKNKKNKQQTRRKGGMFQVYYSVFKALSVTPHERVYSLGGTDWLYPRGWRSPDPAGAEHPKSGDQVGSHSNGPCDILGVRSCKAQEISLNNPDSVLWNVLKWQRCKSVFTPLFSVWLGDNVCHTQKDKDYFLNKLYIFFIISAPWVFFLQQ